MKVSQMIEWLKTQDQDAVVQVALSGTFFETFDNVMAEYYPGDDNDPALLLIGADSGWKELEGC